MSGVFTLICGRTMKRFDDESRALLKACCGSVLNVISVRDSEEAERLRNVKKSVATENVMHITLY